MPETSVREMPRDYGDPVAEYRAVRQAVGVLDRSDLGVIDVTGRDRAAFLHALLSNEVKALGAGQGCAATLLDVHGKVQVVLLVWVLDDRILLVTPSGMAAFTYEALDKYLFAEKVVLEDVTGSLALTLLAGPDAPELVKRVTGLVLPEAPWSSVAGTLDGVPVRLVRGGRETGEPEAWIVVPATDGARVWDAVVAAGARPTGGSALETLRIEAGTPRYGADVDSSVLLPEIPAETLLSQTKGCYPGQEVVVRIRDRGHVNRHLRGLVLDAGGPPARGAEVRVGDAAVGHVTSATTSPALGRPIALAFVRRAVAAPGTRVEVRDAERAIGATVAELPFVR
ncbi:MAG TPA: aminomethyltransferase family protein [Methylomirabilota bacterium]|jgi:folate-binding protein YgfZ|nr:aminomethyltransferase family protein [Methylomirabilota bacterium]